MATHTFDFTGATAPDPKLGTPIFGGWRNYLAWYSQVILAVGDDIEILFNVPGDEYWRIRAMYVQDGTGLGSGQGWQSQKLFEILTARMIAGLATAAIPRPLDAYTEDKPGPFPIWSRQWDGVTYLAYTDALSNFLYFNPRNPTWDTNILPPGTNWRLDSQACETANAAPLFFRVHFLVDRYIVPANLNNDEDPRAYQLWYQQIMLASLMQGGD